MTFVPVREPNSDLFLKPYLGQIDVKEEVSNIHLIWMGKFANGETLSLE